MKRLFLPLLASLAFLNPVNSGNLTKPLYELKEDPFTDKKYMMIALPSNEKSGTYIQIWCEPYKKYNRRFTGLLTMHAVRDSISVTTRWDKEKPEYVTWNSFGDYDQLYLGQNSFKNMRIYIPKFQNHSLLTLRYQTWTDGAHTVTFNLDSIKPYFKQAELDGCNWKAPEKKKKQKSNSGSSNVSVNCNSPVWKNKPRCKK